MKKRFFAGLLVFAMVLSYVPGVIFATAVEVQELESGFDQMAFESAVAAGGTILIPCGFEIESPIIIDKDITLAATQPAVITTTLDDAMFEVIDGATFTIGENITMIAGETAFFVPEPSRVVIKGGSFNFDPTDYVDMESYVVTFAQGVYIVEEKVTPPVPEVDCASGHTYDDNLDGICNVCDVQRKDVEERTMVDMFRMYNPNSGEHFYTGSEEERDDLVNVGWHYEGVAFTFPANTGAPVYRLFNEEKNDHIYTMDKAEKAQLESEGWRNEGVAFNSAYNTEAVQYRLHNPNAMSGAYHFTNSEIEKQDLLDAGWIFQGIGWYSCFG